MASVMECDEVEGAATFRFDDPARYLHGTPHEEFTRIRRDRPFAWHQDHQGGGGYWLAMRHRDVVALSKNTLLFATSAPLLADPLPKELWPEYPMLAMIANNLTTFDHGKHAPFRQLANSLFAPARIAQIDSNLTGIVRTALREARDNEFPDLAQDVALPVATRAILGLYLGVPEQDLDALRRSILAINAMDDPIFRPRPESLLEGAEKLYAYGMNLLRRGDTTASPTDFFGQLLQQTHREGLSREQLFLAYWFPLAAGAFDTTASVMAGGMHALMRFPRQMERLRAFPELIPLAIDEMIRWVSPVIYFRRTATADAEYGGHKLKKGDRILLCYASANRDESVFDNAAEFDVGRTPNHHVSFGYGPHYCLGARLAFAVLKRFFTEFVSLPAAFALEGPPVYTRSAWMNRMWSLPAKPARVPYAI